MTTQPTAPKWWSKFTLAAAAGAIAGLAREIAAWTLRHLLNQ